MRYRHQQHASQSHLVVLACTIACTLLAAVFALAACGAQSTAIDDPLAVYRPAMKAEFQKDLDNLGPAPRYAISVTVDPAALRLTGTATIVVPNVSTDPWDELVFRLYPALDHYRSSVVVQSALVGKKPATFAYSDDNTAIRVNLDRALLPGDSATVQLNWRLDIPKISDTPAVYALFGLSQQMLSLPLFYPSLAVYQNGPAVGTGAWWQLNGTERGDAAFSVASLFVVTVTMPSEWVPVTSGVEVATTTADGATQHVFVTGPSREFVLHASPVFESVTGETYGTRVHSYYLPGDEAAGRNALKYTMQALAIYSDRFGEYPFTDMRVAPAPTGFRGMEYPQVMLIGVQLYTRFRENLEMLVVHEMAHQWWYNIVHNDPVTEPWLDEALAEYSMRLYMESMRGVTDAEGFVVRRWQTPLNGLKTKGQDTQVDQPVNAFKDGSQYETIVYGKGALFYDRVRDAIGTRRFDRFLHNYLETHRWGIVDTQTWLAALRDLPDPSLVSLYEQWIKAPSPTAQSASERNATPTPQTP
ncbi:MAG: M1 family metallopeptidase [Anaerolineales bacterium]|nr:M1 family metallopeptidase [Anaerolineales bacterium]